MASAAVEDVLTHQAPVFGDAAQALAPLLEHLREGCIFVDHDMRIGFLNGAARRDVIARGDDPTIFPGRSLWELIPYPSDTPARLAVERALRESVPTYLTTKGTYGNYWVETDIIPQPGGILVYYRDVTSHSVAEVARNVSESKLLMTSERLRVLIDEAPIAVIALDHNLRVAHWNPAAEAMFQWSADEVLGRPLPTIPAEEEARHTTSAQRAILGDSLRAHPARRQRKDGVLIDVQMWTSPLRDEQGAINGLMEMLIDVSANRKLEAQLRMAQKMEAVGLLAGGVAHDFNNLLTAIKGFTSLLQMTLTEGDESKEFLGEINKAADRAASLTAQLLAFSRRQILRPEPLDLNARIHELERMLRLLLREDGNLTLELDANLSSVLADPGQIEQVILNLIVNARDAIRHREGGQVIVRTSNAELTNEFQGWGVSDAPGHYVRLDVSDNGVGMDRATQARIFDPFFTTKEPGQGTGLGLATVFGIVKQSDGYVWVKSSPNGGSTFSVYLPRAKGSGRTSGPSVRTSGPVVRKTTTVATECILLVEDETSVRRVARRVLELQGYQVVEAADGATALELASRQECDLLLTDVMMPNMPGPVLAEEMRRQHPEMGILFISGHSEEVVREGLLDPNTPFLRKPFTPSELAQKVRDALDQRPKTSAR